MTWDMFLDGVLHKKIMDLHWRALAGIHDMCRFDPTFIVTLEHEDEDLQLLHERLNGTTRGTSSMVKVPVPTLPKYSQSVAIDVAMHYAPDFLLFGYSESLSCFPK